MTITIVTTPGSASANSYLSTSDFETYTDTRLRVSDAVLAALDDYNDTVAKALLLATKLLDQLVIWNGEPTDSTQALQWPRSGLVDDKGEDVDDSTIPVRIEEACAELAIALIESDRTAELASAGISRINLGSIAIDFNSTSPPTRNPIPDIAWQMVSIWGRKRFSSGGCVPLVRA